MALTATWLSAGRKARERPNPAYPKGIDLDISKGALTSCAMELPYPAPECGSWLIECGVCGLRIMITAAGRPDDPRSIKLGCAIKGSA